MVNDLLGSPIVSLQIRGGGLLSKSGCVNCGDPQQRNTYQTGECQQSCKGEITQSLWASECEEGTELSV